MEEFARKLNLGNGYFDDANGLLEEKVKEYLSLTKEYDDLIRYQSNFHIIQDDYDKLFKAYTSRLEKIGERQAVSLVSIYED